MTTLWRTPTTEAEWLHWRTTCVTSTESPALFGMSPYITKFELWHNKHGTQVTEFIETNRTKWGKRFEVPIALGIAEDEGWHVKPLKSFALIEDLRAGSSFDYLVTAPGRGEGILEIKNVDGLEFIRKWYENDEGALEAPAHIEVQLQHQLMVSGHPWGCIAAMVGGNRPMLIIRERDEDVCKALRAAIQQFWASVDANTPPEPDFERDADALSLLYAYAEPGKVMDAKGNADIALQCREYKAASLLAKEADERKTVARAILLTLIGDAEKVIADGYTISAGVTAEAEISYTRKAFRAIRITQKKEAKT